MKKFCHICGKPSAGHKCGDRYCVVCGDKLGDDKEVVFDVLWGGSVTVHPTCALKYRRHIIGSLAAFKNYSEEAKDLAAQVTHIRELVDKAAHTLIVTRSAATNSVLTWVWSPEFEENFRKRGTLIGVIRNGEIWDRFAQKLPERVIQRDIDMNAVNPDAIICR